MNVYLANWKTTLVGVLAGAVPVIIGYLQGNLTLEKCILGVLIAVIGYFSKDASTGSKPEAGKL